MLANIADAMALPVDPNAAPIDPNAAPIVLPAPKEEATPADGTSNSNMWVAIGVVLLIVLIIGGGVWFANQSSTTAAAAPQRHDAPHSAAHHESRTHPIPPHLPHHEAQTQPVTHHEARPQPATHHEARPQPVTHHETTSLVTSLDQLNGNWRAVLTSKFNGHMTRTAELRCIQNGVIRHQFGAKFSLHGNELRRGEFRSQGPVLRNTFKMIHQDGKLYKENTYFRLSDSCPTRSERLFHW